MLNVKYPELSSSCPFFDQARKTGKQRGPPNYDEGEK